jgi:hypothetical protein
MQGPKKKKHKKISKFPILKSAIPVKQSFKNMREITPFLRSHVSKLAMPLVGLLLSSMILGCGSSGGGDDTTPTPESLTLEQRIGKAQAEALANGCKVVDININYSLLAGGENSYGGNFISKQGDKGGAIETVPSSISIKCGDQIHNFVFADEAEQSSNVKKVNEAPVGDINEFFKTDKNTEEDVEAYIKEKIDLTSLCRFSVYPACAGTIDDDTTETMSVVVSGKDCETPKWYINDDSVPVVEGNSLVASISNLLSGENDITIKVTNPAGTNFLYIKRIQGEVTNDPATAIKVSVTPTEVQATTPMMTGSEVVTDIDESVIVREWYDNDVLMPTGAAIYEGPFVAGHIITYKATADGVISDSTNVMVQYSPCLNAYITSCFPSKCKLPGYIDENMPFEFDIVFITIDNVTPYTTGEPPSGFTITKMINRINYKGIPESGTGGYDLTLKAYSVGAKEPGQNCEFSETLNVRGNPN